jgi:hypothetical protein
MLKSLIEKRTALFAEYDALKAKLETEKRTAFTNEEREAVNKIKLDIEELDNQIKVEKDIEEKRNAKLDILSVSAPAIITSNHKDFAAELRNLGLAGQGKMSVPFNAYEKRATVTTSTNAAFKYTDQVPGLSIDNGELVLDALGAAKTYFFESGAQSFPSISPIDAASASSEGASISDVTLTSAAKVLTPTFKSASVEVTKVFLASSKPENIADLIAELRFSLEKQVEKDAFSSMSGLTAASTGSTLYASVLNMEAAIRGPLAGYVFNAAGVAKAKQSKVGTDQKMVWENGFVNGYAAKRSVLSQSNYAYALAPNSIGKAYWGDIQIEVISDSTLARAGKVLLIASVLADAGCLDNNRVSIIKNVSAHS